MKPLPTPDQYERATRERERGDEQAVAEMLEIVWGELMLAERLEVMPKT